MDEAAETVLSKVRDAFSSRAPFAEDRELAGELVAQARPMVRSFTEAFASDAAEGWEDAAEAYSLLNLLGRHLGERSMTPGAAMIGCDLLYAELCSIQEPASHVQRGLTFRGVFVEGFVGGVDARAQRKQQDDLLAMQPILETASGTLLLVLAGPLRAETIEALAEEFGRILFRRDASQAIVHFEALTREAISPDTLEAIIGIDVQARTLGCRCTFVGMSLANARDVLGASPSLEMVRFAETMNELIDDVALSPVGTTRLRSSIRKLDRWLAERARSTTR